jgi:uncharacterized protein
MDLAGKTALVTGANGGIGRALVERLAAESMATILAGVRDPAAFDPVQGAEPVRMDLSSQSTIEDCVAGLGDRAHAIDLLVNNAGRMTGGLLEDQDLDEVYAMFQVNVVGLVHLTARVLPGMLGRGEGKVVNNASISGYAFFPAATTYAASKAGVVALNDALRRELRGTGVSTLQLVTPGVDTDMLDATEEVYGRYMDTSGWEKVSPAEWADKIVDAIRDDRSVLEPLGKTRLAKLASHGPGRLLDLASARMFSRTPRR